uniref:Uncharacterized protein n=1 Tax=viral metagenome TaxID=1070528 RepID=A0A6M3IT81_9ZZZZ
MTYRLTVRFSNNIVAEAISDGEELSSLRTAIERAINLNGSTGSHFTESQATFSNIELEIVRLPVSPASGIKVAEAGFENKED